MNKERRELIAKALVKIGEAKGELQSALDEEQDYYDNMPEGLQNGEKGEVSQDAIVQLEEAIGKLDDVDDLSSL